MSWIAVGAVGLGAGAVGLGAGAVGYAATRKKPNSALEDFELPEYFEDPDYRKSQDFLSELGIDILGGDIPDYFKPIGETGGAEFENYLNLVTGDIKKAGLESAAAIGRGGGGVQDAITREVGETTTRARYEDYVRSIEGRERLFTQGRGITEGVRGAGQMEGQLRNAFNLDVKDLEFKKGAYWDDYDAMTREWQRQKDEAIGEGIGTMLGGFSGMGVFSGMGGGATGGTGGGVNAVAGGKKSSIGSIGSYKSLSSDEIWQFL